MTFGTYPQVSLKEAREKLSEAKKALQAGLNPGLQKKALNESQSSSNADSFEVVAREWFENKKGGLKDTYMTRIWGRLEKDLLPFLGQKPIGEITAPGLLEILRKIETRGVIDTAHRCLQYCGQIFRYAIATGRMTHDIAADLRGALKSTAHSHFASRKDVKEVGGLLKAIDSYTGHPIVRLALKMAPYVFVRPGELRHAEWSEFDLGACRVIFGAKFAYNFNLCLKSIKLIKLTSS
jgi:integrase